MAKVLCKIDIAYAYTRHVTGPKVTEHIHDIDAMLETAKDESNKRKVEAKSDLEGDCSTMRNALSEEKLNDKSKGGDTEKIERTAQDVPEGATEDLDEWRRLEGKAERARASMTEAAANADIVRGAIAAMDGGASIREVMSEPVEAALRRIASDSAQTPALRQLAERLVDLKGRSTTPESSAPPVFRPPLATVSPPGASERLQRLMAPKTHKKGKKGKQLRSCPGTPLARDNPGKHKTT